MKKRRFLRTFSIIIFTILAILAYLWIYIFPSIEKINRLKRDIKEYSRLITDSENETVIFAGSDNKEDILFNRVDSEFNKRLDRIAGAGSVEKTALLFEDHLRKSALVSGIHADNIMISRNDPEDPDLEEYGFGGVLVNGADTEFKIGLRSAAIFVDKLPYSDFYIVLKELEAVRSGALYIFKIHTELVTLKAGGFRAGKANLIDKESPILKRPVYLTPMRLNTKIRNKSGEKN